MTVKKRQRRKSGGGAGIFLTVLFLAAGGYIVYLAFTRAELLTAGLFGANNARAPVKTTEPGSMEVVLPGAAVTQVNEAPKIADSVISTPPTQPGESGADNPYSPGESSVDNPYSVFSYYIPDKLSAYEAYAAAYPSFSAEEVTWRVNAGLDRPFFTDAVVLTDANPLLVNPYHRLPDDFAPAALDVIDGSGRQAMPETINAFLKMREGANQNGLDISVQSAYRTIAYQQGLYDRAGGDSPSNDSVARPAYSEHHTGRALDLWGPDGLLDEITPTATGRWVAEHAHEYGFIVRYTEANRDVTSYIPEPWHITYVGLDIAGDMHRDGIGSLEEYTAKNPGARLP